MQNLITKTGLSRIIKAMQGALFTGNNAPLSMYRKDMDIVAKENNIAKDMLYVQALIYDDAWRAVKAETAHTGNYPLYPVVQYVDENFENPSYYKDSIGLDILFHPADPNNALDMPAVIISLSDDAACYIEVLSTDWAICTKIDESLCDRVKHHTPCLYNQATDTRPISIRGHHAPDHQGRYTPAKDAKNQS